MTPDELAKATGQANYQNTPRLVLNEVLLNGDKGFWRKRIWLGRTKENDSEKPEEVELGENIQVIFLKIRRKLVARSKKGEITFSTNEHNTVNDTVAVYEGGKEVFKGTAKEAREKYESMRTVQVIYALFLDKNKPELVRLTLKGSSLGSENKPEGVLDFYQYLGSFGEESITSYITNLGVVQEHGMKDYYSATYTRGQKVDEALFKNVLENLDNVLVYTNKQDEIRGRDTNALAFATNEMPTAQYPDEDIRPEDIPFD